jgi:hypothetical protein
VPKETVAIVLFMGLAFGLFWGSLSLVLWSANEQIPAWIIAPLWLTAEIGTRLPVHPYLAGALASGVAGLVPAGVILALARLRGW